VKVKNIFCSIFILFLLSFTVKADEFNDQNKYDGQMYSFFKWQWDLMRKDKKSIKY